MRFGGIGRSLRNRRKIEALLVRRSKLVQSDQKNTQKEWF